MPKPANVTIFLQLDMIYNHKLINDLAWAIGSPSLLDKTPFQNQHLLSTEWGQMQLTDSKLLLAEQDKSPQEIQSYLSANPRFRLGYYFEDLVAYWLTINPRYQILCKNLTISENKITLGEIDFIIHDLMEKKTIHLEVAIKFYLQANHNNKAYWFGPNLRDRLDLKLEKTFNKQINFSETELVKKTLSEKNITIDEHRILLKGRLFNHSVKTTDDLCWITASEYKTVNDNANWIMLNKTHWLSEINNIDYNFLTSEVMTQQAVCDLLDSKQLVLPVCFARIENDNETNRIFITSDSWQDDAIATL